MDNYDRAAELAVPGLMQFPDHNTRALSAAELHALITHLVGTEMPVTTGLRALHFCVDQLTLEDLDLLATHIARCKHCNNWTRLADLVQGRCSDCREEEDELDV